MTIEEAVKREINDEGSALAQLALLLARNLDLGEGGAAAVRELRAILKELREKRPVVDHLEARKERKRQAKWAQMLEGSWEWSDEEDDWVRVA
jgi:hypothetical protein